MNVPGANPQTRWNFAIILLDFSSFTAGVAFMDMAAVLPVLVTSLTDSKVVLGLFGTIQRAGWLLPQLLGASFVLHRARRKPFVVYPCLISRIPFYVLAAVLLHPWAKDHRGALLGMLLAGYVIFWFGDGLTGVPWHDIIARSIPPTLRGRFFGSMQAVGGLLAVGSACIVGKVLSSSGPAFPRNFGLLYAYLCVGLTFSTIFLALIREPESQVAPEAEGPLALVRAIPRTLREHPRLRRLIVGQNVCGIAGLAVPFYAVYAYQRLGLPESTSSLFIAAAVVGTVGGGFVWAYLCDRFGSTRVIRGVAVVLVLMPAMALAAPLLAQTLGAASLRYLYALVFLLSGCTAGGAAMGFTAYNMEIAPEERRPVFLGLQSTLCGPTILMPTLGGVLLKVIPYEALFGLVIATGVVGAIFVRSLREPRTAKPRVEVAA